MDNDLEEMIVKVLGKRHVIDGEPDDEARLEAIRRE